jgi:hypothetical protein
MRLNTVTNNRDIKHGVKRQLQQAKYCKDKIHSNRYIKATQRNLKMWPLSPVSLYIQVKIICIIH